MKHNILSFIKNFFLKKVFIFGHLTILKYNTRTIPIISFELIKGTAITLIITYNFYG